jgi:L-lactate dehydrogenase complex protein LldF
MDWKHLSYASSLCGACTETCPVKIDLHHHLLHNRRNAVTRQPDSAERFAFSAFAFLTRFPSLLNWLTRLSRPLMPLANRARSILPPPVKGWVASRDLPPIPARSFRDYWRTR